MDLTRRLRRLRSSPAIRSLVRETHLQREDFVLPLFVSAKVADRQAISSMPGVFQLSETALIAEAKKAWDSGLKAILLFGIPTEKNDRATGAYADDGVVQNAVRRLKKEIPEIVVITDVCLCEYMNHGHCGITEFRGETPCVDNDKSVELIVKTAVSHAAAGADIVAPSDMMDGRVGAIRRGLDDAGFQNVAIMSYAAKFASAFYGPFREAAESAPCAGDRRSYQMDAANVNEALQEVALDVAEGADIVMVKPGIAYLDVLWRVKEKFGLPTAVYNVSGEYAAIKAAAANGWIDEKAAVLEQMIAFKRAGADLIITYWAAELMGWIER